MSTPLPGEQDHYLVLETEPGATFAEIHTRYSFLCQVWRPDRFESRPHQAEAVAKFAAVLEAFEILSDPTLRAAYDARRKRRETLRPPPVSRCSIPPPLPQQPHVDQAPIHDPPITPPVIEPPRHQYGFKLSVMLLISTILGILGASREPGELTGLQYAASLLGSLLSYFIFTTPFAFVTKSNVSVIAGIAVAIIMHAAIQAARQH